MGVLDRATRQQVLTALESIPVLSVTTRRTLLLQDLPRALVGSIERDEATAIDLANIINACDAWGPAALRTMIENALNMIAGSTAATQLQAVLNALPSDSAAGASAPTGAPPPVVGAAPASGPVPAILSHVADPAPTTIPLRQASTRRVYAFAFLVAFATALFVHFFANAVVNRSVTGFILSTGQTLAEWLLVVTLAALPALAVAWLVQRRGWSAITRMVAGAVFGLALAVMMMGPLLDFRPFGADRGFIALLFNCAMIAAGTVVGLSLTEQRHGLDARDPPQAKP